MQIEWEGKSYEFDPATDMTVSRQRQVKAWFPTIGTYLKFVVAYGEGDPDALAVVMWIMKSKAGEATSDPVNIENFSAGLLWRAISAAADVEMARINAEMEAVAAPDPLAGPLEAPSAQEIPEPVISTVIPTTSEASTSVS